METDESDESQDEVGPLENRKQDPRKPKPIHTLSMEIPIEDRSEIKSTKTAPSTDPIATSFVPKKSILKRSTNKSPKNNKVSIKLNSAEGH